MQRRLGLLYRANGAQKESIGFIGMIALGRAILAPEGNIITVTPCKDQIVSLQHNRINDFLKESTPFFFIIQPAITKLHQQLMFRTSGNLRSLKTEVNQIPSNPAGQSTPQQTEILIALIFRHHARTLPKRCDDLLVIINKTPINGGYIAPVPAYMTPDLTDFLLIHIKNSLPAAAAPPIGAPAKIICIHIGIPFDYSTYHRKNPE